MNSGIGQGIVSVLVAIVGVAALAVIFAPRARTSQVIEAGGGAFAQGISAAVAPVTGGGASVVSLRPVAGFGLT